MRHAALADPSCVMVNRNQGAGTRVLDRPAGSATARPEGYWNQPRSHTCSRSGSRAASRRLGRDDRASCARSKPRFIALAKSIMILRGDRAENSARRAGVSQGAVSEQSRAALKLAGFRPASHLSRKKRHPARAQVRSSLRSGAL